MDLTRLPRSLDPLPQESLPSYLLRLAHRLELTPARIASLTGLAPVTSASHRSEPPMSLMLALEPVQAHGFADATGLSDGEVAGLCLDQYAAVYPPLAEPGRRRRSSAAARASNSWVLTHATRYCPACLAGDGSAIQQTQSGGWQLSWRLAVVAACVEHQQLLRYYCPTCGQPAQASRRPTLLPRMSDPDLHPAQCRATMTGPGRQAGRLAPACGARLDQPIPPEPGLSPGLLTRILTQQRELLSALLTSGSPAAQAAARDLTGDLITLAALIKLAWPVTGEQVVPGELRGAVEEHVDRTRRTALHMRGGSPARTALWLMQRPPGDPATCAGLLLAAADLRGLGPGGLLEAITPMTAHLTGHARFDLRVLRARAACSATVHTALSVRRGGFYAARTKPARPETAHSRRLAPCHVPQFLPADLCARHLAHLRGISPKLLRRAASFKLFELAGGGTWIDAAGFFGTPLTNACSTLVYVRRWAKQYLGVFENAVESVATELEGSPVLIDYHARRRELAGWTIPLSDWDALAAARMDAQARRGGARATYDDRMRRASSVVVWADVTQGEHIFAPMIMAQKREHGRSDLCSVVTGVVLRNQGLRSALRNYAEHLAAAIE
jgi:hypothetical protein